MSGTTKGNWRLFCLPKMSRLTPVIINDEELSLLELVVGRLSLAMARDEQRKEIFLGYNESEEEDDDSDLPEKEDQGLPSSGTDVRFPSGWTADIVFDEDAGAKYRSCDPVMAAPLKAQRYRFGIAAFPDAQISKFYRLSDFRPGKHAYDYIRLSPDLVEALDEIRFRAGRPIRVLSGYRPTDYNRERGGVSNSTHSQAEGVTAPVGLAADIACNDLTVVQLRDICEEVIGKRGGVADYPKSGFVHVASRRRYRFGPARLRSALDWLLMAGRLRGDRWHCHLYGEILYLQRGLRDSHQAPARRVTMAHQVPAPPHPP